MNFKLKYKLDRSIDHYKAHLAAKAFKQQYEVGDHATFNLVVKSTTIYLFLSLAFLGVFILID